jgi:hypothetical protein
MVILSALYYDVLLLHSLINFVALRFYHNNCSPLQKFNLQTILAMKILRVFLEVKTTSLLFLLI